MLWIPAKEINMQSKNNEQRTFVFVFNAHNVLYHTVILSC